MSDLIKVLAEIEFLVNEKGRQGSIHSGYRPLFIFPNARTNLSGKIGLINKEALGQGETGLVEITFIRGMIADNHFTVGQKFSFAEGSTLVGKGVITEIA
jgi:translation elongation factor EF-Tu-like GTPase